MTTSTKGTALVTGAFSGIVERDPDQEYSFRDDAPTGCEGNALVESIVEVSEWEDLRTCWQTRSRLCSKKPLDAS